MFEVQLEREEQRSRECKGHSSSKPSICKKQSVDWSWSLCRPGATAAPLCNCRGFTVMNPTADRWEGGISNFLPDVLNQQWWTMRWWLPAQLFPGDLCVFQVEMGFSQKKKKKKVKVKSCRCQRVAQYSSGIQQSGKSLCFLRLVGYQRPNQTF